MVKFENTTIKSAIKLLVDETKNIDENATSTFIDFSKLVDINNEFFEDFIERPSSYIHSAKESLQKFSIKPVTLRFNNLSPSFEVNVKDIRPDMIGKFLIIPAVVKNIGGIVPRVMESHWRCVRCGTIITIDEYNRWSMRMPLECYKDQGGCGKPINETYFEFQPEASKYQPFQKIIIQEAPEKLKTREKPRLFEIHLSDDLCDQVSLGERIKFSGILKVFYDVSVKGQKTLRQVYLETNNLFRKELSYDEIILRDERIDEIKKLSEDKNIQQKLIRSLAPTVFAMGVEKQSILLQLVGGVPKKFEKSGMRNIRGNIHILFVGEPGIAKSSLAQEIKSLLPNSIYVSGKGASVAGLTCTAIKNKDGEWDLEAGAMVLADNGAVIIDEIDKVGNEERGSIHQAMSTQQVEISKAGINATFNTRCSVLAIANPKFGRFDNNIPLIEQINFDAALLDRFDLIFTKVDKVDEIVDGEIADHILELHRFNGEGLFLDDIIHRDLLRDYIAYARRLTPKFDATVAKMIKEYYVKMRIKNKTDENEKIPITPRHLESIIRLSEANAKLRLSETITTEDFETAKSIVLYSMKLTSFDSETGTFDVDISTGTGKYRKSIMENTRYLHFAIDQVGEKGEKAIINKAIELGCAWDDTKIIDVLRRLHLEGEIISYKEGFKNI